MRLPVVLGLLIPCLFIGCSANDGVPGGPRGESKRTADKDGSIRRSDEHAELVKLAGVVTIDGEPLGGAMVMFLPEKGENGRPASGVTELDGTFELSTFEPGDGVLAGSYRAVVTKDQQSKKTQGASGPVSRIPKVYTNPELTTLKYSVKQGMNRVELKLTSKP